MVVPVHPLVWLDIVSGVAWPCVIAMLIVVASEHRGIQDWLSNTAVLRGSAAAVQIRGTDVRERVGVRERG
jgi:hypothetical protein